ncbi:keratin, type I cytoskeletal 9-like isoform X2 [Palaemon carinicauda]|uniref:keratin, type I cytoskeletal 9-like isoform X2 n=1 Tax=Palaemon carinicauda TaxID=392227 RepID=UPI0035B5EC92
MTRPNGYKTRLPVSLYVTCGLVFIAGVRIRSRLAKMMSQRSVVLLVVFQVAVSSAAPYRPDGSGFQSSAGGDGGFNAADSFGSSSFDSSASSSLSSASASAPFGGTGSSSFDSSGGSAFGGTGSSSFDFPGDSAFGSAGSSSFDSSGGSTFGGAGSSSFDAAGGSALGGGNAGSSFGGAGSSSFDSSGGSAFGGAGSSSFDAAGGSAFGGAGFGDAGGASAGFPSGPLTGASGVGQQSSFGTGLGTVGGLPGQYGGYSTSLESVELVYAAGGQADGQIRLVVDQDSQEIESFDLSREVYDSRLLPNRW